MPIIYDLPPEILRMMIENLHGPDHENIDSTFFDIAQVCNTWRYTVFGIVYHVDTYKLDVDTMSRVSSWSRFFEEVCAVWRAQSKGDAPEQIAQRQMWARSFQTDSVTAAGLDLCEKPDEADTLVIMESGWC